MQNFMIQWEKAQVLVARVGINQWGKIHLDKTALVKEVEYHEKYNWSHFV